MAALSSERFSLLLLIALSSSSWLFASQSTAQTFTADDRGSILRFVEVLIDFLEAESDNATVTPIENTTIASNETTIDDGLETTTLVSNTTEVSTLSTDAASESSTETTLDPSVSTSTENSTSTASTASTATSTATSTAVGANTVSNAAPTLTRMCFKRRCYKFSNDRGYIY